MSFDELLDFCIHHEVTFSKEKPNKLKINFSGELDDDVRNSIVKYKHRILGSLDKRETFYSLDYTPAPILPSKKTEFSPLSFSQERLWLVDRLELSSAHYHIYNTIKLSGLIDFEALNKTIRKLFETHKTLRTVYREIDGGVHQLLLDGLDAAIDIVDLSVSHADISVVLNAEITKPFDLSSDLMMRVMAVKLAEKEHVLCFVTHHIATDGWSMNIMTKDFCDYYNAFAQHRIPLFDAPSIEYSDYAMWQREWLQADVLEKQLQFWVNELSELPPIHKLPLDYSRPKQQTFVGQKYNEKLDVISSKQLKKLTSQLDCTLFTVLQSVFALLLSRWSGESDVVMGTPVANRNQEDVNNIVGFFANTLVLRTDCSQNIPFSAFLEAVKNKIQNCLSCQYTPFEKVVERVNPERSLAYHPLFQILFSVSDDDKRVKGTLLDGVNISPFIHGSVTTQFDLALTIHEDLDGFRLSWAYSTDLFTRETIARLSSHYTYLLQAVMADVDCLVKALPLLPAAERQLVRESWNDMAISYPGDQCVHHLFEAQVATTPDAVAVVFDDTSLSYQELNRRANQLAHYLIKQGVTPDTLVGLCLERSLEMIVGLLGILKAGGAYVPIDPAYPQQRMDYILADTQVQLVLTQSSLTDCFDAEAVSILSLNDTSFWASLSEESTSNPIVERLTSEHLAYVIYTSGTTGQPKGCMLSHANVSGLFKHNEAFFNFNAEDVWSLFHGYTFDFSVWEIGGALLYGGRLVVIPRAMTQDLNAYYHYLIEQQVTILNSVPSVFMNLIEQDREYSNTQNKGTLSLRYVIFGGEALNPVQLLPWVKRHPLKQVQLINMYGITESTIHTTIHRIREEDISADRHVIGKALTDRFLVVLNDAHQLCPIGVVGELYIGGGGLARGYLNRPELTAERFITNPFDESGQSRLYKTGDLVRRLADDNLEYIGRRDHQVKVRGYRIECGEVEAALRGCNGVRESVVIVREDTLSNPRLVAYVTAVSDTPSGQSESDSLTESILREALTTQLPSYMVPSAIVILDGLPLTVNGKIDHKALPAPEFQFVDDYQPPQTATEAALLRVWESVLNVEGISITANFFELGGHSLLAMKLVSHIREQLGWEVPVRALFEAPTIHRLGTWCDQYSERSERIPEIGLIERIDGEAFPLSYSQQRLWFVDQLEGSNVYYNQPIELHLVGVLDIQALKKTYQSLVDRHEVLRTVFQRKASGDAEQVILSEVQVNLPYEDLHTLEPNDREESVRARVRDEAERPFDLSSDLKLRMRLLRIADDEHVLLATMHHIASDGWSRPILKREFNALYQAYRQGQANPLPKLPLQYLDYAVWQRQWLQGEVLDRHLSYWRDHLSGVPVVHRLPLDYARPDKRTYRAAQVNQYFGQSMLDTLTTASHKSGATLFMICQTVFAVLLSKWSGETDIVMGTPIANRTQTETESVIGFFVNTLVLRTQCDGNPEFSDLLHASKEMMLNHYAYQHLPFEMLVDELNPERNLAYNPLCQILFQLDEVHSQSKSSESPSALKISAANSTGIKTSGYDLELSIQVDQASGLSLDWTYNIALFKAKNIEKLSQRYEQFLEVLLSNEN